MASTINTNNIDVTYPIAGQDNDSQGFRDNYQNITDNFAAAKQEIEELQNKVIVKEALIGDPLDNDFDGALIQNAEVRGLRGTVIDDYGTGVSGTIAVDVSRGPYQKIDMGGNVTLQFDGFSPAGTHSTIQIEFAVTAGYVLTLPAGNTYIGVDNIDGYEGAGKTITFRTSGVHILEFSTASGPTGTISVNDMTRARLTDRQLLVSAPGSAIGLAGHLAGMIAADASYIYVCISDYDGVNPIWVRSAAGSW